MNIRDQLLIKYGAYEEHGHHLFAVTLSTYVKSEFFCRANFGRMWNRDFIYRVNRRLPFKQKNKFDHDFVAEASPANDYHFHGLLAFSGQHAPSIWGANGLKTNLERDLDSLKNRGEYRYARINKHLVEPVRPGELEKWIKYITKSPTIPTSSLH